MCPTLLRLAAAGVFALGPCAEATIRSFAPPLAWRGPCVRWLTSPAQRGRREEITRRAIEAKLMHRLGFVPRVRTDHHHRDGDKAYVQLLAIDRNGRTIGTLPGELLSRYQLGIGQLQVDDLFKNKGVSELLFHHVLLLMPDVLRVSSSLTDDNKAVLQRLRRGGLSCEDAVRRTPAGRLRARFGFTHFAVPPECENDKRIYLIMDRSIRHRR